MNHENNDLDPNSELELPRLPRTVLCTVCVCNSRARTWVLGHYYHYHYHYHYHYVYVYLVQGAAVRRAVCCAATLYPISYDVNVKTSQ